MEFSITDATVVECPHEKRMNKVEADLLAQQNAYAIERS